MEQKIKVRELSREKLQITRENEQNVEDVKSELTKELIQNILERERFTFQAQARYDKYDPNSLV